MIRDKIADASNNGTKCVSARTIPLTETDRCNVVDCPPGINATQKLKKYVQLTAMSHLGGLGHLVPSLVVEATRLGKGATELIRKL